MAIKGLSGYTEHSKHIWTNSMQMAASTNQHMLSDAEWVSFYFYHQPITGSEWAVWLFTRATQNALCTSEHQLSLEIATWTIEGIFAFKFKL